MHTNRCFMRDCSSLASSSERCLFCRVGASGSCLSVSVHVHTQIQEYVCTQTVDMCVHVCACTSEHKLKNKVATFPPGWFLYFASHLWRKFLCNEIQAREQAKQAQLKTCTTSTSLSCSNCACLIFKVLPHVNES